MRLDWLVALLAGFSAQALAQQSGGLVQGELHIGKSCAYVEEMDATRIVLFESNTEAENVIGEIVKATGLRKNFRINAGAVPNAAALIEPPSTRFIVYNPSFMIDVRSSTKNRWAPISILAHEVGHHLNGHTLEPGGSRPEIELEADEYSGFVLQRMGASLADAKIAMEQLGSETGGPTHPAKRDRLVAIAKGWADACEQAKCADVSSPVEPKPEPVAVLCKYVDDGECDEPVNCPRGTDTNDCRLAKPEPKPKPEPETCEFVNDGTCDEPDPCPRGTDTADCWRGRQAPPPIGPAQPQQTFCCDGFGRKWCSMAIQLPVGSVCMCPGVPGSGNVCF